jgi:hypothetical protein
MGVWRFLLVGLVFAAWAGEADAANLHSNVKYGKSGGIAGVVQKLTVRPDGSGVASNYETKRTFKLSASRMRDVEKAVRSADLAHARNPKKTGDGADGFSFSVEYGGHRVSWSDFTANPSQRVLRLYSLLDEIYEAYRPR